MILMLNGKNPFLRPDLLTIQFLRLSVSFWRWHKKQNYFPAGPILSPHPACLLPAWHTPTVFVSTNLNCQLDFSFSSPTFVTICCNLISRSLVSNTKNVAGSTGRYSSFLRGVQGLTLLNQRLTLLNQHLEVNRPISPKFLLTYLVGQQQINNSTTTMCSFAQQWFVMHRSATFSATWWHSDLLSQLVSKPF